MRRGCARARLSRRREFIRVHLCSSVVSHPLGANGRTPDRGERVAKVMARAGLCSRRDAGGWIGEGGGRVNGKRLDSPAFTVSEADVIAVDGKPIPTKQPTRLWRYHKPRGLIVAARDPQGRPTVFDSLPKELPRVV